MFFFLKTSKLFLEYFYKLKGKKKQAMGHMWLEGRGLSILAYKL